MKGLFVDIWNIIGVIVFIPLLVMLLGTLKDD